MDLKSISSLKTLELFEVVNKYQNMMNSGSFIPQFIQFAKNVEEMRRKWSKCEDHNKELETFIDRLNSEKNVLQRQVNELKVDIERHYEQRMKAENERDKLQQQIETLKKILDDKQSYTMFNDEERHLLFQTPNHASASKRLSHNQIDETGSLISDYTEDDIDVTNDDELETKTPHKRRTRYRNNAVVNNHQQQQQQQPYSPQDQDDNDVIAQQRRLSLQRNKRQKGSLTRNENVSEKKRNRTRSHDTDDLKGPHQKEVNNQAQSAITAITTLKFGEDGGPITVTSEIQHDNSMNKMKHQNQAIANGNSNNKLEITLNRPKAAKHKRPSREFLRRSIDESESTDSEVFWNTEATTAAIQHPYNCNGRNLLTPIVETPNVPRTNTKTTAAASTPLLTGKKYKKPHHFKNHVILNSETCSHCDKRTKFGKVVLKCRDCDLIVHQECKEACNRPCYLPVNYPINGLISDYVTSEIPRIPAFLQYIIAEIETKGLDKEVGLYRVNGSDIAIKQLKEKLIKRHQLPDLRKINDVHVLCSFVKDFLNNLAEHLITYDSWMKFARSCEIENQSERFSIIQSVIKDLPAANRDTLAFVILHLQRVAASPECKMSESNLATVLGPSVVGNSVKNVIPAQIVNELKIQHSILENLLCMPSIFYENLINNQESKMFKNAPVTPEILRKSRTATVLSSLLGPAVNNQPQQQTPQQSHPHRQLSHNENVLRSEQRLRNARNHK